MGKHDRFNWPEPNDYQENHNKRLQKENENLKRLLEMRDAYIDKLEKALAESASRCANVEKAFIQEAIRNVEV